MNNFLFKMPACQNLKDRVSTINNAYATGITPIIQPTDDELLNYYNELEIKEGECAYCGGDGNGVDHLKPLVKDGMPTGYITDIHNLVPCCQKCNSSKGSKPFREWYKSDVNLKRLRDLGKDDVFVEERYKKICDYEDKILGPIDYEKIVGEDLWNEYKKRKDILIQQMNEDQEFLDKLKRIIMSKNDERYL